MNKITRIKKLKEAMLIDKQDTLVKYEKRLNEKADYVSKLIDTLEMIEPPKLKGKRDFTDITFNRKWSEQHDWEDKKFATHFYIQDNKARFVMPHTEDAHDEKRRIKYEDARKRNIDPALAYSLMASMKKLI